MSIFIIEVDGNYMGEYLADSAQDALTQFAKDEGYDSIADITKVTGIVTGIDRNVLIYQINTESLVNFEATLYRDDD